MDPLTTPLVISLFTAATSEARGQYAYKTATAVLKNLRYSGDLRFHISDDGSPQAHRDRLYEIIGGDPRILSVTCSNSEGRGYGASYNASTMITHQWGGVILPLEDDWELTDPLDADPLVGALGEHDTVTGAGPIEVVRLGYIGFTQRLKGQFIAAAGQVFILFDPDSESRDIYAGHPRLELVEFQRRVGEWPIGLNAGETEFVVCGRAEARRGIVWPVARGAFAHFGAIQARDDQREANS